VRGTGHKRPDCPHKNKKTSVVKAGLSKVLRRNEMLANVGGISLPVTLDTGAEVSVLPEEAECMQRLTGETVTLMGILESSVPTTVPLAEVELSMGGEEITTIAAMVPGAYIDGKGP